MQLHCKNLTGGAEPPPLRSGEYRAIAMIEETNCKKTIANNP
ncbi:MAG: hypothetical protein RR754_07675 [Oscillospiraceae bacterium]